MSSWTKIKIPSETQIDGLELNFSLSISSKNIRAPSLDFRSMQDVFSVFCSNSKGTEESLDFFKVETIDISEDYNLKIVEIQEPSPKAVSNSQKGYISLKGCIGSDFNGDSLFIYMGGIVVILEEVIDPNYTVSFKLDTVEVFTSSGIFQKIPIIENQIGKVSVPFVNVDNVSYVYREFLNKKYIPCSSVVLGSIPAFRVFPKGSLPPLLNYLNQKNGQLSIGKEEDGSIGIVSKQFQQGLIPLYQGKKRIPGAQMCGGGNLPRFTYSLCLDEIVKDPNYSPDKVICYVIPPRENFNPCGG